jgi:uroporphyrinogen-III decarboxylase
MFVSLKGQPGLEESFLLKDREDAEKYLSLPVPQVVGEVDAFFSAVEGVQDTGIVDTGLGINPAGFVARLFGSERFAMMTLTDRDIVHILCERQMQIIINRLKFLLDHGVGPYFSMEGEEYIVPPLHGPRDFHDFNTKYDKPIIDLIHDARGRIHVHSHGSVKKVMQEFVDMDVDVLHPFEPPPMGDITPAQAKAVARGKMCLEGNIQINRMYEATPEEIRDETAALIEAAFDDHLGLIVCPTASPYIRGAGQKCFPQYKAMIDTVLQWPG